MKCQNILELIGNTPEVHYKNINENAIYIKLEMFNIGGSIKDRIAYEMVTNLLKEGKLDNKSRVVEATSGNTGIGLALVLGYHRIPLTIIMPENMSKERINILEAYGAKVLLTDKKLGIKGSEDLAKKMSKEEGYVFINQFENIDNIHAHEKTTAKEIIADFPKLDYLVASVGTAGTITGIAHELKKHYPNIKIIGVEPLESPVLSKGEEYASSHGIPGIGAGFVPPLYDKKYIDEVIAIKSCDAQEKARNLALEGLFLGISSAAAILGAEEIAKNEKSKTILAISPDGGSKYLSLGVYKHEHN